MAQHIFTGTAKPTSIPSKVGQHFIDTTNKKHYISVGTSGASDWIENPKKRKDIQNFTSNNIYYVIKQGTSWSVVGQFPFAGTNKETIANILTIMGEWGTGFADFRIYDVTNAQVISTIAIDNSTGGDFDIYETTTISNLPTGQAIFEVHIKHDDAAGYAYISALELEYVL